MYFEQLRGLRAQETIMKKLIIDPTKFQSVFGLTPKNNDLHETLSVRCFHSFLEDYTDNFQTIHDVLSLHVNTVLRQLVKTVINTRFSFLLLLSKRTK